MQQGYGQVGRIDTVHAGGGVLGKERNGRLELQAEQQDCGIQQRLLATLAVM